MNLLLKLECNRNRHSKTTPVCFYLFVVAVLNYFSIVFVKSGLHALNSRYVKSITYRGSLSYVNTIFINTRDSVYLHTQDSSHLK